MPSADQFEWPQGNPLFEVQWRAITEGLSGNGIVNSGDFHVTTTATDMEIQVDPGTLYYLGQDYTLAAAETHVLSGGDANDDRWDTVYFDTDTTASNVREGTPSQNPEPPDIQTGEVLLAVVYVPAEATNISDDEVLNWRPEHQEAENVRLNDVADDFEASEVENALTEVIREAGDPLNGPLDLTGFSGSAPFDLSENPGQFGSIVDAVVTTDSAQGIEHSFVFSIDGMNIAKVYAESDGNGGVQNARAEFPEDLHALSLLQLSENIEADDGTVIWNSTENRIEVDVMSESVEATDTLVIPSVVNDPTTPSAAEIWLREDSGILKWYDGNVVKASGRDH